MFIAKPDGLISFMLHRLSKLFYGEIDVTHFKFDSDFYGDSIWI